MSGPRLNRVVADFSGDATGDKKIRLKDLRGQNVVLYFYPKDSTPGCTQEGLDFGELHAKFRHQNTVIFGVSRDSIASHEKFKTKQNFPFDLLSDPDWQRVEEKMAPVMTLDPFQNLTSALLDMQREHQALAVVRDRRGHLLGIVTLKDLVEEVVGELQAW